MNLKTALPMFLLGSYLACLSGTERIRATWQHFCSCDPIADLKKEALAVITSASSHRIKINRTSLDHLLLGDGADSDKMSHGPSITPDCRVARDVGGDLFSF